MDVWEFIHAKLSATVPVLLLYVLESEGSSPGRKGFKMAVSADGTFCGTIGGGIMEHKLVEKAKDILRKNEKSVLLLRQHHDKEHAGNQSGMICSGSQLNAFIPVSTNAKGIIEAVISGKKTLIELSPQGIRPAKGSVQGLQYKTDADWFYSEAINEQPVIHIIGGGHVSLALSELMHFLGFYVNVYDDRQDLNTMQQNSFADEKHSIRGYDEINAFMAPAENDYVVVISFGYRTDKAAMRQLLKGKFFYLGLIGSDRKVQTLFAELKEEGISAEVLARVHAPVGINIYSKTAPEIAVSIAAEIIREKNKDLSTGRKY
ncbi:MAG: XdhC family protein [Chitinophagaceae bacterium]|nr:XdhC family protein [Chitinophagaceae bacterium]